MPSKFDAPVSKVLSPVKLAHVVLRTNNLKPMVEFYKSFLGAEAIYENEFLAFLTYDEEHHRIAITSVPGTKARAQQSCGLEHIAFSFDTLDDLLLAYRQRKQKGIGHFWAVNHGPTTSIYYKDPDENFLETQVDNFENAEDATDFMRSKIFSENPIGTDFDPEAFINRLDNGEDPKSMLKRLEIGPRGPPEFA